MRGIEAAAAIDTFEISKLSGEVFAEQRVSVEGFITRTESRVKPRIVVRTGIRQQPRGSQSLDCATPGLVSVAHEKRFCQTGDRRIGTQGGQTARIGRAIERSH